ncbi:MAG: signal peptide peptidase SppA [Gemmatimonadota bacterium]|nr:MAG: signal peptide peptidase SppA [Gemmatimonadota bacterium]
MFGSGLLLVLYTAAPRDGMAMLARDRIAVLPLRGVITQNHRVLGELRDYRDDGSVKGFVLWVNSPGGEVAPSQAIYRELARAREDGYPVVAAIGSVGASGAYYAALGADTILAMPGSLVGSIGVLMEFPNAQELLEKVGLRFEVIKSADHKDLGSPYREVTEAERALLQDVVDDVYGQFLDVIAEERAMSRDSVIGIADGRLLSGRLAVEYGLIDGEGDLVDAIAVAGNMAGLGPEPRTVMREERRRVTWLDLLSSLAALASGRGGAASGLSDSWSGIDQGPRLMYLLRYR